MLRGRRAGCKCDYDRKEKEKIGIHGRSRGYRVGFFL
jgi:hypothetical protein